MFICLRDFGFISIVYGQSLNVFWRGAKCGRGDTSILDEGGGDLAKTPCGWGHAFPPPESFQGVAESLPALFSFQVNTLEGVLSAFLVHGIKLAHFGFRVDFHGDPPSGVIPFCLPSFFPPDFHVRGVGRRPCLRGRGAENILGWCERRDSNPHAVRHENLNLGRLPISPLSPWKGWRKLVDIFLPPVVSHSLLAKKRPPNRKDPGV